jgi:hypothetical protein
MMYFEVEDMFQSVKGKTDARNSCVDSTMEERQPIYTGARGVLAGMLAEHKTRL